MTRRVALVFALGAVALTASPAVAQQQDQREHVVRRGDTLWDLARAYLSNPFLWPAIFEANRGQIRDPHWIYPDQRVLIPPVLAEREPVPTQRPAVLGEPAEDAPRGTVVLDDLAPELPAMAPEPEPLQSFARAPVRESEYRTAPWLSAMASRNIVGRVARVADPASANDRLASTLRPYERVQIGGLRLSPSPGDSLLIVRIGRDVQRLGQLVQPLGVVRIDSMAGQLAHATIIRQFGDARVGDDVFGFDAVPELPQEPATETSQIVAGHIVEFLESRAIHGASDYGFVNIGRAQGIRIGDELIVSTPATPATRRQPDPRPAEDIGVLRVIRVEDGTATVRVLGVNTTVLAPGLQVRRVRTAS